MKYEYKKLYRWDEESLNNLGNDGWKLIAITNHTAILMREIHEIAEPPKAKETWWPPLLTTPPLPNIQMNCVWCNGSGKIMQPGCTAPTTTCNMCHGTGKQQLNGQWPSVQVKGSISSKGAVFEPLQYMDETFVRGNGSTLIKSLEPTPELPVAEPFDRIIIDEPQPGTPEEIEERKKQFIGYGAKELREKYSTKPVVEEKNISTDPIVSGNNIPEIPKPLSGPPELHGPRFDSKNNADHPDFDHRSFAEFIDEAVIDQKIADTSDLRKNAVSLLEEVIASSKDAKSNRGWNVDQQRALYKTIARMSLNGPQMVPFVHGGFLYRPEPRPKPVLSDLAESVIVSAETKMEPNKFKTNYEAILDEVKKEQENWKNQANTGGTFWTKSSDPTIKIEFKDEFPFIVETPVDWPHHDITPKQEVFQPRSKLHKGHSKLFQDVIDEAVDPVLAEALEYFPEMKFNPDAWGKRNSIPSNEIVVENNSDGVLDSSDLNSSKFDMKEYYSLPAGMEDVLKRCSSYKDRAYVTVRWNDIKEVVNMLGDQAPVNWQEEVNANPHWINDFGYSSYMWELRDAKQTMLDLGSMWNPGASCDLTDTEKAEEHIEQDWEALAKTYPSDEPEPSKSMITSPYYDEYDDTKNYTKVLFQPIQSVPYPVEGTMADAYRKISEKDKAETIETNPKSWAAWKREAERLKALLDVKSDNEQIDFRNPDDDCGC